MARILGVIRLSRYRDESTSVERQREVIAAAAASNGDQVVGWAEDIGVSATVDPFARPSLGEWLKTPDRFDGIAVWRIDRVARRVLHLARMLEWCETHGKTLRSATEGFDVSTPLGRMMAQLISMLAEGELEAIRERTTGSRDFLRRVGRWPGGRVPFGYAAVPNPDGRGIVLDTDPASAAIVRDIAKRVLAEESCNSVAAALTESGILAPHDYARQMNGKPVKGDRWHRHVVERLLRSRLLVGEWEHNGRVVRGDDGAPVIYALRTVLSRDEYDRVQAALNAREVAKTKRSKDAALLLKIAYCADCGEPLYQSASRGREGGYSYYYYRCSGRNFRTTSCSARLFPRDVLDDGASEYFLAFAGAMPVLRKVVAPADNHTADLAQVEQTMTELRADRAAGLFSGDRGSAEFRDMYSALEARRTALSALPQRPASVTWEPTGRTIAEEWSDADIAGRRKLMIDTGFECRALRDENGMHAAFRLDPGLRFRAAASLSGDGATGPTESDNAESWRSRNVPETFAAALREAQDNPDRMADALRELGEWPADVWVTTTLPLH